VIPVNEPLISKNAKKYIKDCLDTGWVSSAGKYIDEFENAFKNYIGTKFAVTTTSGTTALHLALASARIGPGDEVIIPDLTIISCALAPIYVGAKPVLVDVENKTGNINPRKVEEKITNLRQIKEYL
jgi:perosamine synthetase